MISLQTNPKLDDELCAALVECWVAVTNAGGSVGFVAPTTAEHVRPLAAAAFDRVERGVDDLVVALEDGDAVAGFGFLEINASDVTAHWGAIKRLQRHPARRGGGIGARILEALEGAAAERGLVRISLTTRGSLDYHHFYVAHGYRIEAVLPERLRVDGGLVPEYVLGKRLDGGGSGPRLQIQRLDPGLELPRYAHPGDAGLDLCSRVDVHLAPGERALVPTGVAIAVPVGHVGLVHPRSGLAVRHGVSLVNSPGTIDAGYRGEVAVPMINLDPAAPVALARGDRIAQLVIQPVAQVVTEEVAVLDASARGEGGFGSTGR